MDPQLLTPSSAPIDFHFDSTSTSPYATAPSSPKILFSNFFYSAPTSPVGVSPMNPEAADDFQSADPFESCEENHEQKNDDYYEEDDDTDFAFDFSGQLERPLISAADELFHGGKIKPLEPPPLLQSSKDLPLPRSPKLYPVSYKKKYSEPFSEAMNQSHNLSPRGRERTINTTRNKTSQSLSPMRVSDILSDHHKVSNTNQSSPFGFMWYNKWNLKNLLLFRSTSEGSAATSDDPLKKYAMITKREQDTRNSSFRSSDGGGSVDGSSRRKRMKRKVSAHEIHYTANRAMAEEMKNKTFLPYRSGLLGCLGFSHNLREVSRGR